MSAFAEQLECPDLVEPQIIVRGKHAHNNTDGKGTDCHPQHEYVKRRALRRASYNHTDRHGSLALSYPSRRFSQLCAIWPNKWSGTDAILCLPQRASRPVQTLCGDKMPASLPLRRPCV